jgi:hypothetical protein
VDRAPHPIRLVVADDLRRSRLTVFFRLLLAIPHLAWLSLWGTAAAFVVVIAWVVTLFKGQVPEALHEFFVMLVRYTTHVYAYVSLASNPFPGFTGQRAYPVDVEIDPPARQGRLSVLLRLPLALPALLVASALGGSGPAIGLLGGGGAVAIAAFLGWFAALVVGRMPRGLRDLAAYSIGYAAQVAGYFLLLTSRYPDSHPDRVLVAVELPPHPVRLAYDDGPRRSRLLVFFRLMLVFPHIVWLTFWLGILLVASPIFWLIALVLGRLPRPLHRFVAAFVRYQAHVAAFLYLVGNPFPGFVGAAGSYPVDLDIDAPERQRRLVTAFRLGLALPAILVAGAYGGALLVVGVLGWFAALLTGRMPSGLAAIGAASVRYSGQTYAYLFLATGRYPYASPTLRPVQPAPPEELPLAAVA